MHDAACSAFSVFFTQSPFYLAYQREMTGLTGRNNVQSLFGAHDIPTDVQIRNILDSVDPDEIAPIIRVVGDRLLEEKCLDGYRVLNGTFLVALDGTDTFSSTSKIFCPSCHISHHKEGTVLHRHIAVTTSLVAHGEPRVDKKVLFPTEQGTPQGGIASPTLANMVLDGLERLIKERFPRGSKVNFVRYADDWIVTGSSKEMLEDQVLPVIVDFLRERGLEIASEKTRVVHIQDGFTFLGQRVRRFGDKCLTQPSPESVKSLLEKTRNVMKEARSKSQEWLVETLNPIIRGWGNYHRHSAAKATFSKVDHIIWTQLWSWLKKRHPQKGQRWIYKKYFHQRGSRNWIFAVPKGGPELIKVADIKIVRHVKIKALAHPFDPKWTDYLNVRKAFSKKLKSGWDRFFGPTNDQKALE